MLNGSQEVTTGPESCYCSCDALKCQFQVYPCLAGPVTMLAVNTVSSCCKVVHIQSELRSGFVNKYSRPKIYWCHHVLGVCATGVLDIFDMSPF